MDALGSYTTPDGLRRSVRIALKSAVEQQNADVVEDVTLDDGFAAAFEESTSSGGSRMRGGGWEQTKEAIKTLKQTLVDASGNLKAGADEKISSILLAIPNIVRDYSGTAAKGALIGTVAKYPTIFAKITAGVIKMLPIPRGGGWAAYGESAAIITKALAEIGIDIANEAIAGPIVAVVIGLYFQNQRATSNGISMKELFVNDAKKVLAAGQSGVDALNSMAIGQIEAFKTAYAEQTRTLAADQLKSLAQQLVEGRTEGITSTGARLDNETGILIEIPDVFPKDPGAPIRQMAKKVKPIAPRPKGLKSPKAAVLSSNPDVQAQRKEEMLEKTAQRQSEQRAAMAAEAREASSDVAPTASSSMGDAQMNGGRRRKTRKPKKVRRVTRRRRAFAY